MDMTATDSGRPRVSLALIAAAAFVVVAAVAFLLVGSNPAHASLPDEGAGVSSADIAGRSAVAPLGDLAAAATVRAGAVTETIAAAATPPPPPLFACPVPESEFIDSWGFSRSGGRRHKGVDMMAPHGSPVLAPVAGTVRHSNSKLGGLGFYLVDTEGNEYFGSHLASLGPVGWVEAGTQIGTVGSTGNASAAGPHLHFEVKTADRGTVNPYPHARFFCGDEAATPDLAA